MIYNRTEQDIVSAKQIINEKVKKFLELSEEEKETISRGTISRETITRIEEKQRELISLFNQISYFGETIESKDWEDERALFYQSDLDRIIENSEKLKRTFFVYSSTPKRPSPKYDYIQLNAIEKILFDLESMYDFVVSNFKECDTFYCGEG